MTLGSECRHTEGVTTTPTGPPVYQPPVIPSAPAPRRVRLIAALAIGALVVAVAVGATAWFVGRDDEPKPSEPKPPASVIKACATARQLDAAIGDGDLDAVSRFAQQEADLLPSVIDDTSPGDLQLAVGLIPTVANNLGVNDATLPYLADVAVKLEFACKHAGVTPSEMFATALAQPTQTTTSTTDAPPTTTPAPTSTVAPPALAAVPGEHERLGQIEAAQRLVDAWNAGDRAAAARVALPAAVDGLFGTQPTGGAELVRCRFWDDVAEGEYPIDATFYCEVTFDNGAQSAQLYVDGGASAGYEVTTSALDGNPPGWEPVD